MKPKVLHTHWPLILATAILVTCCAMALRAATTVTDGHLIYALDDAYIHMAMAKNFARHGIWGCTPFHFSSSSSSPLWTLLLSVVYVLGGVRDSTPLLLNVLLGVGTLAVIDRTLRQFAVSAPLRASALVGVLIITMLPGLVLMGMEHVLHLLLTVWLAMFAAEILTSDQDSVDRRQTGVLCLLAMLLASSRYEGFFLVAIVCLSFMVRGHVRTSITVGTAALVPVVGYGAVSVLNGALFLPNSLLFKAGGENASALHTLLKPFGPDDAAFYQNNPTLLVMVLLGLVAALAHAVRTRSLWRAEVLLPLWLSLMIVAHGHFVFSSTFWAYRYDAYLLGFAVVTAAVTLRTRSASTPAPGSAPSRLAAAALLAAVIAVAHPRAALTADAEIAGARNTYLEHYETSQFVRAYYSRDAVVVNDLGAVTYFTETQILDLVGLGNIEPVLIMRRTGAYTADDVERWTAAYHPRIAIIQLDWSWAAPRIPERWIKAAEVAVPPRGQRIGFFAIDPSAAALLGAEVDYHYTIARASSGYRVRRF